MRITEVRVKLMDEPGDRLKAFCSITFDDCFVIRDLKIIEGSSGPFVAMPSRKLTSHCRRCGMKNHLRAAYCNQCGARLEEGRAPKDNDGRAKLYADIAHPINCECREMIQDSVIQEFYQELERAKLPGYVSRYDDYDYDFGDPPRSKPIRVDTAHDQSAAASAPHLSMSPSETAEQAVEKHSPEKQFADSDSNDKNDLPNKGFGAGIFPET